MFNSNKNTKLGERIKYAIKNKGITQRMLAEKIGKYESEISKWCKGDGTPPYEILVKIVEVTGCSPGWLLTGEGEMKVGQGGGGYKAREGISEELSLLDQGLHRYLDLILEKAPDDDERLKRIINDIGSLGRELSKESKIKWEIKKIIGG